MKNYVKNQARGKNIRFSISNSRCGRRSFGYPAACCGVVHFIRMLKYMKRRHLSNLEVIDEGRYWETGDDRILKEKMRLINEKLDFVSRELSSERVGDARRLSVDEIAARMERLFHSDEPYV